MLFVSVVGLASSGGLVSFYFRVGGSVAGCGASFRSPVSVMADLLGVFLFLRWQKEEDRRHKKEEVSPLRLADIRWACVLEFVAGCLPVHAEYLPVWPSIRSVI